MGPLRTFNWKICGVGGYGLQASSNLFGKLMLRNGFSVHVYDEFPSIIKGGPATGQVAVSEGTIRSHRSSVDLLLCLNEESIRDHVNEIVKDGCLLYDAEVVSTPQNTSQEITAFPVPLTSITKDVGGEKIMRNVVAIGCTLELLGMPLDGAKELLQEQYGGHGAAVVEENTRALEAGASYTKTHRPAPFPLKLHPPRRRRGTMLVPGNEALGMGALAAGVQFYAGYPMTPSSSILSFMVKHGPTFGAVVRQLPDEMAVVNAGIGASFAGVRSMVATSGGGFSLMVESLGLAAMTETPMVIVDAQRPGPSTGLPTWTEQGDLRFVLHASQGDFPRVVLAPGDVEECFRIMPIAFNIADRYQTPVVVLTDKYLGESGFTTRAFSTRGVRVDRGDIVERGTTRGPDGFFPRYASTANGVSPRPLPGTPGLPYLANSDEHDEFGLSNEAVDVRRAQHEKRLRKIRGIASELPRPALLGVPSPALTVVSWGSTKGPILDAIDLLAAEGLKIGLLHTMVVGPFPTASYRAILERSKQLVVVEGNATAQFAGLVREHTGVNIADRILRSDGRQFEATELATELRQRLQ